MRVEGEPFWFVGPYLADERFKVLLDLVVAVAEEASDGGVLDGSVHPLVLTVRPRMVDLDDATLDAVGIVNAPEKNSLTEVAVVSGLAGVNFHWRQAPCVDCRGWRVGLHDGVRCAVRIEGIRRREAARRFGIDLPTVGRILSFPAPLG